MAYQTVFKRYEIKYLLTPEQKQRILSAMAPFMALDHYGRTTIRNVYFDTESYRLIRRSLEKPVYKEKLRLRSYRQVQPGDPVFVELKKKYKGVVYKRRLSLTEEAAIGWLNGGSVPGDSQIAREIDYFRRYYAGLRPTVFLSYNREAYYCRSGGDFRITFDEQILARRDNLSLAAAIGGIPLLEERKCLMEIKTAGGIPLWMTRTLTEERIFKTSFSKYGKAYETLILPHFKGDYLYA